MNSAQVFNVPKSRQKLLPQLGIELGTSHSRSQKQVWYILTTAALRRADRKLLIVFSFQPLKGIQKLQTQKLSEKKNIEERLENLV